MGGGVIGNFLLRKIVEHDRRKKIKGSTKQLLEISQAYLIYVDSNPEDFNSEVQKELEIIIDNIFLKF